jgi:hypothetical protein
MSAQHEFEQSLIEFLGLPKNKVISLDLKINVHQQPIVVATFYPETFDPDATMNTDVGWWEVIKKYKVHLEEIKEEISIGN